MNKKKYTTNQRLKLLERGYLEMHNRVVRMESVFKELIKDEEE